MSEEKSQIWCPYSNKIIQQKDSNPEHIIPLSLGGNDKFTIPVDKVTNSTIGSEIDGRYSNEFLTILQRNRLKTKGHSKKLAKAIATHGKTSDGEPVQVNFGQENKNIELYLPKKNKTRIAKPGETLDMSFKMNAETPIRLLAKIALSAGYFIYGNRFKNDVRHSDLRLLLKERSNLTAIEINNIKTKYYDPYTAVKEEDSEEHNMQKYLT